MRRTIAIVFAVLALVAGSTTASAQASSASGTKPVPCTTRCNQPGHVAKPNFFDCTDDTLEPTLNWDTLEQHYYVQGYARFEGCEAPPEGTCTSTAYLEQYLDGPGVWEEVAAGKPTTGCNYSGSRANYTCERTPTDATYKTEGVFVVVDNGTPYPGSGESQSVVFTCY